MNRRGAAVALCAAWLGLPVAIAAQTPVGTIISNQAEVSFIDGGGRTLTRLSEVARLTVAAGASLTVSITAFPDPVAPGDSVLVEFAIDNPGNATAQGVVATATADVAGRIAAPADGASVDGLQVSWPPVDVAAGARLRRSFRVRIDTSAPQGSEFGIEATATAANIAALARADLRIGIDRAPNLVLTKSPERTTVAPGDVIEYAISCVNTGNATAREARVRDDVAAALRPLSSSRPVTAAGLVLTWELGDIASGDTVSFTLQARVGEGASAGSAIHNRVSASAMGTDPDGTPLAFLFGSPVATVAVTAPLRDEPTDAQIEHPAEIYAGADVAIEVRDADANRRTTATDSVEVRVENARTGETETVFLPETGVDSGAFAGTVHTAHGPETGDDGDGTVLVVPGDLLAAAYADLETTSGVPVQRTGQIEVGTTTIVVRVYPRVIIANGNERALCAATLTDEDGRPLPDGTPVTWRADAGAFAGGGTQLVTPITGGNGAARATLTGPLLSRRDTARVVASLAGFDAEAVMVQLVPGVIGIRVFDGERGVEVTAADPDLDVLVRVAGTTAAGSPLAHDVDLDDSGVFVVEELPRGNYGLEVTVREVSTNRLIFAGLLQQIDVGADGSATPPGNNVSGSLRSRSAGSGSRYAGSVVELVDRTTGTVVREGVADPEGGYEFQDLDPGAYELRVVFDDGTVVSRPVPEPSEISGTILVNLDILIDPFGIVFDPSTGEAVAGVEVSLRTLDGEVLPLPGPPGTGAAPNEDNANPFTTGADGRYAFLFGGDQVGSFGQPQTYGMAILPPAGVAHLPRQLLLSVQPSRAGPVESTPITMRVRAADGLPLARPNSLALTTDDVVLADIETIALHVPLFSRAPVIELAKVALRDTAAPGDSVDFRLAVANAGNDTARAVTLTDSLGVGWEIEWTDRGTLLAMDVVRWELGDVAPGKRDTLGLRARIATPQAGGTILTNAAYLSAAGGFPLKAETAVFVDSAPRWRLSKQALADSVTAGQEVEYQLTYGNDGTDVGRGSTLIDTLAAELTLVSAPDAQIDAQIIRWSLDAVAAGGSGSVQLVARAAVDLAAGTTITNRAVLIADDGTVAAVDSATILTRAPRLNLVKRALVDSVTQGDQVTFTIAVVNEGDTPVTAVTLVDSLPTALTVAETPDAVVPAAAVVAAEAVTWQLDSLAAGAADTFRVTVEVDATARVTNEARLLVGAQTIATATATIEVRERPPIELSLVADRPTLEAGAEITYTVELRAAVPIASEIVVTDSLPAALVFTGSSGAAAADHDASSNVLTWTAAGLNPERPLRLTFTAGVAGELPPGEWEVGNRVVAQLGGGQRFASDPVETLISVPFLRIEKAADVTVAEIGDFVEYRIRLQNTSARDTLHDVLISDWMPAGCRYAEGTAAHDGVLQEPQQPGAGLLLWALPALAGNDVSELAYRLVVGLDAPHGDGANTARVTARTRRGVEHDAGPATARVRVRPDLFSRGELILGRAWIDVDEDGLFDDGEEVVPGIALLMEDGTRIIADRHGKFSIPEVRPGDHVLRLLARHLPDGLEPMASGGRAAGDPWSRFVHVPAAGTAKANFPFRRVEPAPASTEEGGR